MNRTDQSFFLHAGWDKDDFQSPEMFDDVKENCEQIMDPMNSMMMQQDDEGLQKCLETVMGDNPIGNFLRDLYHYPEKYCECMASLADDTPECFIALPSDEGRVPLSVLKKEICLLEIGCDAIDDFCAGEIKSLDECLPPLDDETFSCLQVIEDCSLLNVPPVSMLAPPELTMSQLPDSCVRVHDESMSDTKVVERYTRFNDVCNNKGVPESALYTSAAQSSVKEASVSIPIVVFSVALIFAALVAVSVVIKMRRANALPAAQFGPIRGDDVELI
jgi:hypothetical protein